MSQDKPPDRFRFGVYELDVQHGELRRSGIPLRLQGKPLRLLGLLVAHAEATVDREAIRRHVWPADVHVEFDQGINACIKQIRAALGDNADDPRIIQTVPRGGYRFLLPVEPIAGSGSRPGTRSRPRPRAPGLWKRYVAWTAACAAGMVLLGAMVVRSGATGRGGSRSHPVLAVLPFTLLAEGKEGVFFRDALADELITQLGRRYGARMSVIARTSALKYADSPLGIDTIGRELGADYILEGSVHRAGDRVRVNAQLIRAEDGSHVWASAFQRESDDLLGLQVELGETIAQGLALKLVPGVSGMAGTTSPEVYATYLRGRGFLRAGRLPKARHELEQAVALDPGFAQAWEALAQTYHQLPTDADRRSRARDSLARALALDDGLPEAHMTLAMMRFYEDYDLEGARASFERALALNPAYAEAHENFAAYFSVLGRHDEAIAHVQSARRLDPLSTMTNSDVGWYYYFAHRYEEAVVHSERTLALDPEFFWANLCIQLAYLQLPDWQGAVGHARREMERAGADKHSLETLSSPDRAAALRAYWRWRLESLEEQRSKMLMDPSSFAQIHMALGEPEEALAELEASFETRRGWILPFLVVDPAFDALRDDPRFRDLVARIRSGGPQVVGLLGYARPAR